jgi:putative nucleotidyltransferase with HDIG domain
MDFDSYSSPDAEELLRSAASRWGISSPDRRIAVTEGSFGLACLVASVLVLVLGHADRSFSISSLLIAGSVYLAAYHVTFPVGSAWSRPTQVAFVPMLFVLPLRIVPLVVLGCGVLALIPEFRRGEASVVKLMGRIGDGWFAIGPVLVLLAANDSRFGWAHWPVYVAAFAAQVAFDVAAGVGRTWLTEQLAPGQLWPMAWLYVVEVCLSCTGLLLAASAAARPAVMLLALPLIVLLGLFARERTERIDNTLALSTAYRGTALLLGDVIEDDDEYTGVHSRAVVDLSVAVAGRLNLDASTRRNVEFGALLHDVGKIRVPKEIIHKPGKLNDAEWAIMREHTVFGEQMLRQVGGTLSSVGRVVRHSHERYDGSGYPDGLAGEEIPIEARIVCACDAFNAMTTNRPYRRAMALKDALAELERCSASHFDPRVVEALLAELAEHPPAAPPSPPVAAVTELPVAQAVTETAGGSSVSAVASA